MPRFNLNWLYFIIIAALGIILWQGNSHPGSATKEVSYSDIKTYIAKGYTNKVVVDKTDGVVEITILPEKAREVFGQSVQQLGKSPSVSSQYPSTDKVEDYLNSVNFKGKITYEQNDSFFLKISLLASSPSSSSLVFGGSYFAVLEEVEAVASSQSERAKPKNITKTMPYKYSSKT